MYKSLLIAHSLIRHLVLIFLIIVIIKTFVGMLGKKTFSKVDNGLGLTLFSLTHTQLLLGLLLYFVSPFVQFGSGTMKDASLRYWTVEHIIIMLSAVGLITAARITSKKLTNDTAKHRRMFIFNTIALVLILVGIALSNRGFLSSHG
jgi:hypothetical protein